MELALSAIAGWAIAYYIEQDQPFLLLAIGRKQFALIALPWMCAAALFAIALGAIVHPQNVLHIITRLTVLIASFVFTLLSKE